MFEFAIFNYGLTFGSLEWGELQYMEITLDGLIWDLGVFNYQVRAKISTLGLSPLGVHSISMEQTSNTDRPVTTG